MPAVTLTDHGSLAGAVELYREAGKQGIKPIIGCEVYVADDRKKLERGFAHLTLLAETNEGYANLIKLVSGGYLEGYYYKPRVDWELLDRYSTGIVALSGCMSGRVSKALLDGNKAGAQAELARLRDVFGAGSTYVELQNAGLEQQPGLVPRSRRAGRRARPAARRHRRRPLPPPRGRRGARGAPLHPVRRHAREPEPLALRDRPVLLQVARRDGARLPGPPGGARPHARGRRALQRDHGARPDPAPDLPGPGRARGVRLPRRAVREGPPAPLRARHPGAAGTAALRAEDDQGDGLRRLLPDRLGLHPVRQARRGRRRPRPRLGGGLARRLLPGNHGYRPDPLRPPLRAVPEPRAQVDARHRHRFLRPRARPRHQLRGRQVRARPGRPDHHLRDDDGPRRGARRRPRARRPVRPGRPDREAHPRGSEGLPRGVAQAGRRARRPTTTPRRRRARSSTSPGRSRDSSARTRSTPRASSSATGRSPSTCRSSRRGRTRRS